MDNGSLHEGMADVNAAYLTDDPVVGRGLSGPGTFVRNTDNGNRWPDDNAGEVRTNGLIIGRARSGTCARPWACRSRSSSPCARVTARRTTRTTASRSRRCSPRCWWPTTTTATWPTERARPRDHQRVQRARDRHQYYLSVTATPAADPPSGDLIRWTATIAYSGPAISALDTQLAHGPLPTESSPEWCGRDSRDAADRAGRPVPQSHPGAGRRGRRVLHHRLGMSPADPKPARPVLPTRRRSASSSAPRRRGPRGAWRRIRAGWSAASWTTRSPGSGCAWIR